MVSKLLEKKNKKFRVTNSSRRRKKTKFSTRRPDNDKTIDLGTPPEIVEKFDNENRRLSELEKCLETIAGRSSP